MASACDIAAQATVSFSGSAGAHSKRRCWPARQFRASGYFLILPAASPLEIDPQVGDLLFALDAGEDLFSTWNFGAGILDVFLKGLFVPDND